MLEDLNPAPEPCQKDCPGKQGLPQRCSLITRHSPMQLGLYLSLPRTLFPSQMVMSGLHWELNEVDCPLVSAISGN